MGSRTFTRRADGTLAVEVPVAGSFMVQTVTAPVPLAELGPGDAELLDAGHRPPPWRITVALGQLVGPEVDEALGVEEPTVDEWEAGSGSPTADEVRRLATLTGRPVAWLLNPAPPATTAIVCSRGRGRGCHRVYIE